MVTLTSLLGIAKPIPSTCAAAIFMELIPTRFPLISLMHHPNYRDLASVCKTLTLVLPAEVLASIVRSLAEIIPDNRICKF